MNSSRQRKRELVAGSFKPRNPLAMAARARKAGAHGPDRRADRRAARLALRKRESD